MTKFIYLLSFLFLSSALMAESCFPDSVYLVRHAEKEIIEGERNPSLTKKGMERAQSLSKELSLVQLNKIFSSQFKRTQQTVEATAKAQKLKVLIRDAISVEKLANEILLSCNEDILVSGHSNTVPQLLTALGLKFEVTVGGQNLRFKPVIYLNDKKDYGSLFKVTFRENGERKLELSSF